MSDLPISFTLGYTYHKNTPSVSAWMCFSEMEFSENAQADIYPQGPKKTMHMTGISFHKHASRVYN